MPKKLHPAQARNYIEIYEGGNQNPYYQSVLASTFGYLAQDILYVFSVPVLLSKATLFHHSLGFYGIGLIIKHKMGAGLAMHFLLNEMSTPFVNNLYFISKSKKAVPTWLQAGNGICLMVFVCSENFSFVALPLPSLFSRHFFLLRVY